MKKSLYGRIASSVGSVLDRAILSTTIAGPFARRRANAARPGDAPHARDRRELLAEAIAFYRRPEILSGEEFFRAPSEPRVVEERRGGLPGGGSIVDLKFASAFEPAWSAVRDEYLAHAPNRFAYARAFRQPKAAATIVCLHGYRAGAYFFEERAFSVRWLYSLGLHVILFQLPFHGHRGGDGAPVWPSVNVARTNEGFGQAIHDLRALIYWQRRQNIGKPIAVTGMSLGGYTTALLATVEELDFAAPMIPVASFPDLLWAHGEGRPERARAEREGITVEMLRAAMDVHTPLARTPKLAPERVLVMSAEGDQIAPPEHATRLARHFGAEELRFAGGHVLQVGRAEAFRALGRKLGALGIIRR